MALGIVAVLLPAILTPIVGADTTSSALNQVEVITSDLTGDGTVGSVRAEEWLRATGEDKTMRIDVSTSLNDIQALAGTQSPNVDGSRVSYTIDSKGPQEPVDVYFGGTGQLAADNGTVKTPSGDRQLPLTVETEFRFNDDVVDDLSEIAGKTGEFDMTIMVENRSGVAQELTYNDSISNKEVTSTGFVFTPFTVGMGPWFLDNSNWSNVIVDNATIQQVGTDSVIQASNVLFPPTMPGKVTMRLSADVKNFDLNSARVVATPGVGAPIPDSVQRAQTQGDSAAALVNLGVLQFLNGFEKILEPPPAQAFPFLAESLADGAKQVGALTLLGDIGAVIRNTILPFFNKLDPNSVDDAVEKELMPIWETLTGTIGESNYSRLVCSPSLPASACRYGGDPPFQEPELPPNAPLATVINGIFANPVTGLPSYGPVQDPQTINRLSDLPGPLANGDLFATPTTDCPTGKPGTCYTGSLYNWAAMARASLSRPTAGELGAPTHPPFTWPSVTAQSELYTTQALDTVAIQAGSLWPGAGVPKWYVCKPGDSDCSPVGQPPAPVVGIPEKDFGPLLATPSVTFAGLCTLDAPFTSDLDPLKISASKFSITCNPGGSNPGWIPNDDILLRDLLDGSAESKVGLGVVTLDDLEVDFMGAGTKVDLTGFIDFGNLVVQGTAEGLQNFLEGERQGDTTVKQSQWKIVCTSLSPAPDDKTAIATTILCGPGAGTGVTIVPPATISTEYNQISIDTNAVPVVKYIIDITPNGAFGDFNVGCFWPMNMFPDPTVGNSEDGFTCDYALAGNLKAFDAAGAAIEDKITNPDWNFDNWWRGDPGFQSADALGPFGPRLHEQFNLIAFELDRKLAMCPSALTTSPGSGIARAKAPKLDTPCSAVIPDSTSDPQTLLGNVNDMIVSLGDPSNPTFVGGQPANLATALVVLAGSLESQGAQAQATIVNPINSVADGVLGLIATLTSAVAIDTKLVSESATTGNSKDLNTAASKAGLLAAQNYQPFFGPASVDNKQADAQVILVWEIQGVKS